MCFGEGLLGVHLDLDLDLDLDLEPEGLLLTETDLRLSESNPSRAWDLRFSTGGEWLRTGLRRPRKPMGLREMLRVRLLLLLYLLGVLPLGGLL